MVVIVERFDDGEESKDMVVCMPVPETEVLVITACNDDKTEKYRITHRHSGWSLAASHPDLQLQLHRAAAFWSSLSDKQKELYRHRDAPASALQKNASKKAIAALRKSQ